MFRHHPITAARIRTLLDLLATLLVASVAGVLLWRTSAPQQSPGGSARPPQVERLDSSNLYADVAGAVTRGDAKAAVVLIEYSDFQCPFCKRFADDTFGQIDRRFVSSGLVQYVFRNYPMEKIHPAAMEAAMVGECASHDGRFWEMRDALFLYQAQLGSIGWLQLASRVGLDGPRFQQCLTADLTRQRLVHQKDQAKALGVSSTPTFLIGARKPNGTIHILRRILGAHPFDVFERTLEETVTSTTRTARIAVNTRQR